jgi:nucleoside-diphosphate-sugar epimerase
MKDWYFDHLPRCLFLTSADVMFSIVSNLGIAVAGAFDPVPRGWGVIDCRPLIDGFGNSAYEIAKLKQQAILEIGKGGKVCFVCDFGHSRSNLLAALTLAETTSSSVEKAVEIVRAAHPESSIKSSLLHGFLSTSRRHPQARLFGVTGASGLLGGAVVEKLSEDGKVAVLGLSRKSHGEYFNDKHRLTTLIRDNGITDVLHLAYPKPFNSYQSYIQAMQHLVALSNACIENKCFLHFVSGWTVFDSSEQSVVDEECQVNAHSIYGQSKILQETFLSFQSKCHGLNLKIYRLPGIYDLASLEPRFLRYLADCAYSRKEMSYHAFQNGSASVPLCSLSNARNALCAAVTTDYPVAACVHLASIACHINIGELASVIGLKYGFVVKPVVIERSVFSGVFTSRYEDSRFYCPDQKKIKLNDLVGFVDELIAQKHAVT